MQKQLERMDKVIAVLGGERNARTGRRESALRGRKVPPKYRSPSGENVGGSRGKPLAIDLNVVWADPIKARDRPRSRLPASP